MQTQPPIKHFKTATIVYPIVDHLTLHSIGESSLHVFEDFSSSFQDTTLLLQDPNKLHAAWDALTHALLKKFTILIVFYINTEHALQQIEILCNILQKTHTWPLTKLYFGDLVGVLNTKLRQPQTHARIQHYYQTLEKTIHYYARACDQSLKSQHATTTPRLPRVPYMSNLNQCILNPLLLQLKKQLLQPSIDATDTSLTHHKTFLNHATALTAIPSTHPAHPLFFLTSSNSPENPECYSSSSSQRVDRPTSQVIRQDIAQEVIQPVLDSLHAVTIEYAVNNLEELLTIFKSTFLDNQKGLTQSIVADHIVKTYTSLVVREKSSEAIRALQSLTLVLRNTNTCPVNLNLIEKQLHSFLKNRTISSSTRLSSIQHSLKALHIIQSTYSTTVRCQFPSIDRAISMLEIALEASSFSPYSSQKTTWPVARSHAASQTMKDSSHKHIAYVFSIKSRITHTFQRWKNQTHRHRMQRLQQQISQLEDHRMHSPPIQTPIQPSSTSLPTKHFHAYAPNTPASASPPDASRTEHPPANQEALIQSVLQNLSPTTTECTVNNNLNDTLPLFVETFKNFRLSEPSPHAKCYAWQQLADTIAIKFQSLVMRKWSPRAIHNLNYLCNALTTHQAWPVYHLNLSSIEHKLHAAFQTPSNTPRQSYTQHSLTCLRIIQKHCLDACHAVMQDTFYAKKTSRLTKCIASCLSILEKDQSLHTEAQRNPLLPTAKTQTRSQVTELPSDFVSLKNTSVYFFQRWKNHTYRHRLQDLQQRISQLENALAQAHTQKPASPSSLFSAFSSNPDSFFIPHDTTHQKTHAPPRLSEYEPLSSVSKNGQPELSLHQTESLFFLPSTLLATEAEAITR